MLQPKERGRVPVACIAGYTNREGASTGKAQCWDMAGLAGYRAVARQQRGTEEQLSKRDKTFAGSIGRSGWLTLRRERKSDKCKCEKAK
jgi:hypothetical protein